MFKARATASCGRNYHDRSTFYVTPSLHLGVVFGGWVIQFSWLSFGIAIKYYAKEYRD